MIRKAIPSDQPQLIELYREVAAIPDALARNPDEVSVHYVDAFMRKAADDGLEFVFEQNGRIRGEIHASRVGIASLDHMLTELTIAVAPDCQGQGVGRRLFQALLDEVSISLPYITRVELFCRSSNERARGLYLSLGFVEEGRLQARVKNAQGQAETDTIMAWLRPAA